MQAQLTTTQLQDAAHTTHTNANANAASLPTRPPLYLAAIASPNCDELFSKFKLEHDHQYTPIGETDTWTHGYLDMPLLNTESIDDLVPLKTFFQELELYDERTAKSEDLDHADSLIVLHPPEAQVFQAHHDDKYLHEETREASAGLTCCNFANSCWHWDQPTMSQPAELPAPSNGHGPTAPSLRARGGVLKTSKDGRKVTRKIMGQPNSELPRVSFRAASHVFPVLLDDSFRNVHIKSKKMHELDARVRSKLGSNAPIPSAQGKCPAAEYVLHILKFLGVSCELAVVEKHVRKGTDKLRRLKVDVKGLKDALGEDAWRRVEMTG